MAKNIVYYLKKMANAGKTIVCTIHQPSSETFKIFDKICILSQTKVKFFRMILFYKYFFSIVIFVIR